MVTKFAHAKFLHQWARRSSAPPTTRKRRPTADHDAVRTDLVPAATPKVPAIVNARHATNKVLNAVWFESPKTTMPLRLKVSSHLSAVMAIDHRKADTTKDLKAEKAVRLGDILRTKRSVPLRPNRPTTTTTSTAAADPTTIKNKRGATHLAHAANVVHRSNREAIRNVHRADKADKVVLPKADHRNAATGRKKAPAAALRANVVTVVLKRATPASVPAVTPPNAAPPATVAMVKAALNPARRAAEANAPCALPGPRPPMARKSSKAKSPAIGLHPKKVSRAAPTKRSSA